MTTKPDIAEIPCTENEDLRAQILELAEVLKTQSHLLGEHGLSEYDFYNSGLFRGAIERIRGQYAATMRIKRDFLQAVLNHMIARGYVAGWTDAGNQNRHDYAVTLNSGRIAAIELKGCLDGNNTNIFTRPPHAHEFVLWSVCSNPGANPRHNVWSGIHTRLSAEIIDRQQRVDGLIVWDWICGTAGRPCPKLGPAPGRVTEVAGYQLPPPCLYLFPATIPSPRNNPAPAAQSLDQVEFLSALQRCFGGRDEEVHDVAFEARNNGSDLERRTTILRAGRIMRQSDFTAIQRE